MGACVSRPCSSVGPNKNNSSIEDFQQQNKRSRPAQAPAAADADAAAAASANSGPITPLPADTAARPLRKSLLGNARPTDVTERFEFVSDAAVLGRGAFATTRLCRERGTGRLAACKSIPKRRVETAPPGWVDVRREVQVMHHLAPHANVVGLLDAFEDDAHVHLVLELCSGGELVDRIIAKGKYTERDAAHVARTLLEVLAYAHDMGVVHRDVKPDNCLMLSPDDDAPLKLADWGFACFNGGPGGRRKLRGVAGTCYYIAPEVLTGEYDEKADVWSCGVVLYVLLCGRPPFCAHRDEDVFRMIVDYGVPDMTADPWPSVSEGAKDAVRRMMTYCPNERPSAREMLQHEWVRADGTAGDNELQPEVAHRMKSFSAMAKLKQLAALWIAAHVPADQIRGLKELFASIDADGSGTITAAELKAALEARGGGAGAGEIRELMALADVNGDGELDYNEFLAATLHESRLQEEANIRAAFDHFDLDHDGRLTASELRAALAEGGGGGGSGSEAGGGGGGRSALRPCRSTVADILREADQNNDGVIDYEEFASMMRAPSGPPPPDCAHERRGPAAANGAAGGGDGRTAMSQALGVSASGRDLRLRDQQPPLPPPPLPPIKAVRPSPGRSGSTGSTGRAAGDPGPSGASPEGLSGRGGASHAVLTVSSLASSSYDAISGRVHPAPGGRGSALSSPSSACAPRGQHAPFPA